MTEEIKTITIDPDTINSSSFFLEIKPKIEKFRILKYPIQLIDGVQEIEVPFRHEIVLFAEQKGHMFVWIAVGLEKQQLILKHKFKVVRTDHEFEGPVWGIRSVVCELYVWHLIDLGWDNK